jgi:archaeal flagellar protein FlaJ
VIKVKLLDKYQIYLYSIKIKVPALYWIASFFLIAIIFSALIYLIFRSSIFSILVFTVVLDLGVGTPLFLYTKHIETIERFWPDALRLIADTMKAGTSFDFALREVASADFGPVSVEFNEVVRRLEMGDTTNDALTHLSIRVDSKIIKRTVTIIQECLRTGAQLAEVLDEIANDTKYMYRVKVERQTKTLLQTIFVFAAGGVIAPFIFGLTNVITQFLTNVATASGIANETSMAIAIATQTTIILLLDIYVMIEVAAASLMISLMRNGKISGAFIYFPIMLTVAYIVYSISQFILNQMLVTMV